MSFFNRYGDMNASSVKEAIANLVKLAAIMEDGP